ncbi:MAG: DNA internalization-related competence protein ComEC/Rec2, partial [Myxococcota bacterium]
AHLLAVSGLHLALVAGLSYRLALFWASRMAGARPTRDRRPLALVLSVAAAGVYAAWTGFGIPVQRAWIFLLILVPVWWMARRPPAAQGLALAAGVILALSPASLFDLGARLSFVATAGLLLSGRAAGAASRSWTDRTGSVGTVTRGLRASAVALAVTAPLLAHAGLPVGPAGLLLNVVAVPWTALVLLPLALGASVAVIVAGPEMVLVTLASRLASWTVECVVDLAAVWPLEFLSRPVPLAVLAGVAGLAFLACRVASTARAVFLSLSVVLWLLGSPDTASAPQKPRLVMIDVGQGDALLVQGSQAAVLVDGGRALAGGPDLGRTAVGPALVTLGVRRLDVVVATHADIDHRGGLPHVFQNFEVGELWLPFAPGPPDEFAALRKWAESRGVPVRELAAGDRERVVGDLRFTPLWPPRHGVLESGNEGSLVLRAEVGGHRVLLTGDIGASSERRLLAGEADLRAEVLKVAHHGSAGSSTPGFLEAVGAEIALVSASCSALSGLPSGRTLKRLEQTGASVWWTGREGAVVVAFNSKAHGTSPTRVSGWARPRVCRPGRRN